tara:strand:+ start:51 stop:623 length:573 start_codon:yes stop_codon:yes gene_type:complete
MGLKKIQTAVFISGNGSNLKNLIKFSQIKKSPINIKLVVSNNLKSKGLNYAKKLKIKHKVFKFQKNDISEKKALIYLNNYNIKLICLAGFMKILSENFIKRFKGKIINIHPSLLPKYKGLNTHERAIRNGEKFSGCTVHYVNSKLDSGKIIAKKIIKILKKDTPNSLKKRILREEHILYPKAVKKVCANL